MPKTELTDSVSTPLTEEQRKAIDDEINAGDDDLDAAGGESEAGAKAGPADAGDGAGAAAEDPSKAGKDDGGKAAGAEAAGAAAAGDAGAAAAAGDGAAAGAADAGDAGKGGPPMIPKGRLDEVLATNAELRERISKLEAGPSLEDIKPDRDYAAELETLNDQWEKGEIEPKAYSQKLAEITGAQARYVARLEYANLDKTTRQQRAQENWDRKVAAWSGKHSEFLANGLRRSLVDQLFEKYSTENPNLSDEELIQKVEKDAFEAFNYTPAASAGQDAGGAAGAATGAAGASKPANPHADRNAADARAQAAASGTPAPITGGRGDRSVDQDIDLSKMKPGKFSTLPKETQDKLLGITE